MLHCLYAFPSASPSGSPGIALAALPRLSLDPGSSPVGVTIGATDAPHGGMPNRSIPVQRAVRDGCPIVSQHCMCDVGITSAGVTLSAVEHGENVSRLHSCYALKSEPCTREPSCAPVLVEQPQLL